MGSSKEFSIEGQNYYVEIIVEGQEGNIASGTVNGLKAALKGTGMSYTECSEEIENEGLIVSAFQCNQSKPSILKSENTKIERNI